MKLFSSNNDSKQNTVIRSKKDNIKKIGRQIIRPINDPIKDTHITTRTKIIQEKRIN